MVEENTNEVAKLDVEQLKSEICRRRNAFYIDRSRRVNAGSMRGLTEAIFKEISSKNLDRSDLINFIESRIESDSQLAKDIKRAIPDLKHTDEDLELRFFRALMGAGILDYSVPTGQTRRLVKCPIPSMRKWFEKGTHEITAPFPDFGQGY